MPDTGPFAEMPRPDSVNTFIEWVAAKPVVERVVQLDTQVVQVERDRLPMLTVYMTNLYIVGEADIEEILAKAPACNVIVTMSLWNSYSAQAKELSVERQVGLFTFTEFMKAVFFEGRRFLEYSTQRRVAT